MKRTLRTIHLWIGLVAGIFIFAMAVSGSVIIFRSNFDRAGTPQQPAATGTANFNAIQSQIRIHYPESRIIRITLPRLPGDYVMIQIGSHANTHMEVYADPISGAIAGVKARTVWLDWLIDLHQNLFAGKTGRSLTSIIGFALLLLSFSGIASWLAGRRAWRRSLSLPKPGPWRRVNYELHRWSGLWANLLLSAIAITGIALSIPDTVQSAVAAVTGEAVKVRPAKERKSRDRRAGARLDLLPLDDYLSSAKTEFPDGVIREIRFPAAGRPTIAVTISTPDDLRSKGGNQVTLDAASAKVMSVDRASAAPLSRKVMTFANAIHKVELGGWFVKIVWALIGLAPVFLFVSGFQIWWSRRTRAAMVAPVARPELRETAAS